MSGMVLLEDAGDLVSSTYLKRTNILNSFCRFTGVGSSFFFHFDFCFSFQVLGLRGFITPVLEVEQSSPCVVYGHSWIDLPFSPVITRKTNRIECVL